MKSTVELKHSAKREASIVNFSCSSSSSFGWKLKIKFHEHNKHYLIISHCAAAASVSMAFFHKLYRKLISLLPPSTTNGSRERARRRRSF
jgi:hypothetical protein